VLLIYFGDFSKTEKKKKKKGNYTRTTWTSSLLIFIISLLFFQKGIDPAEHEMLVNPEHFIMFCIMNIQ
jgi:hypothetical protein